MKSKFTTLTKIERGYSLSLLPPKGSGLPSFMAGSEDEDRLVLLEGPDFKETVISRSPGGYISTWPLIRGGKRFVVSTTMFKPGFNGADATIRLYPLDAGACPPSTLVAELPYTHRITVLQKNGADYLLASTLCSGKSHKEDWTQPGGIHLAKAPADPTQPWPIRQIVSGLNKNHGMDYAMLGREKRPGYLLSCLEGLVFMPIPGDPDGDWATEKISSEETSDAYAFDWDGDGEPEIFSISPFHGNVLAIHKRIASGWKKTVIHDDLALGHVVWAGRLLGRPGLLAGSRRERRELRLYRPSKDGGVDPAYTVIDSGIGPSQMIVLPQSDTRAVLYVAAHGINEVRVYELTSE